MKRRIAVLLAALSLLFCLLPAVNAAAPPETRETTETLEDSSYFTVTVGERVHNESAETGQNPFDRLIALLRRLIRLLMNQKTVSKSKYVSYFASDGTLLWTVYLNADFMYNGKSAVCDDVSLTVEILDADWRNLSAQSGKNGDTAYGRFSMRQYKLGVPLKTVEKELTLTCRPDGSVY